MVKPIIGYIYKIIRKQIYPDFARIFGVNLEESIEFQNFQHFCWLFFWPKIPNWPKIPDFYY